jgi:hypothetical protein
MALNIHDNLAAVLKRLYVRPVIVAVSGGRDYKADADLNEALDFLHNAIGIELLVEGACHVGDGGADERARKWAKRNEVNSLSVPAKAKKYGWPACGPKRNAEMANIMTPDIWVLFPGGRGTNSARAVAEDNGIARFEVTPERAFFLEGFRVTSGEESL